MHKRLSRIVCCEGEKDAKNKNKQEEEIPLGVSIVSRSYICQDKTNKKKKGRNKNRGAED